MTRGYVATSEAWCPWIPDGWELLPIRRLGSIINGGTPTSDANHWNGEVPFVTPPDLRPVHGRSVTETSRTLTQAGVQSGSDIAPADSVLVSIRAPIGYVARTEMPVAFNQGCRALAPRRVSSSRYLVYALVAAAPELDALGRGTTFMELSATQFAAIRLPTPPLPEQRAIADYLDRETAQIDDLITEQQRLIEILRERRAAAIADSVTRGLDPAVEFAPSPVGWIGSSPAQWTAGAVKHLGRVTLGKMLQSSDSGGDVFAPYMRAANVQPDGVLHLDDVKQMWFRPTELKTLDLRVGDVVVVEGGVGGYGRAAHLTSDLEGWGFQNSINRIRPSEGTDGRYLAYFLIMARAKGFIEVYCNVVSMPHLTAEKLQALPVVIPPAAEQRAIADHLDEQTAKIDDLIDETERFIELARERRSALITAAVTGQIDVRSAVVPSAVAGSTDARSTA